VFSQVTALWPIDRGYPEIAMIYRRSRAERGQNLKSSGRWSGWNCIWRS